MLNSKIVNILLAMALLMISACSADDSEVTSNSQNTNNKDQKIRFTASISSPFQQTWASTRSWADTYNDRLPINSSIYVYLFAYNDTQTGGLNVADYMISSGLLTDNTVIGWVYQTQSEVDESSGRSPLGKCSASIPGNLGRRLLCRCHCNLPARRWKF